MFATIIMLLLSDVFIFFLSLSLSRWISGMLCLCRPSLPCFKWVLCNILYSHKFNGKMFPVWCKSDYCNGCTMLLMPLLSYFDSFYSLSTLSTISLSFCSFFPIKLSLIYIPFGHSTHCCSSPLCLDHSHFEHFVFYFDRRNSALFKGYNRYLLAMVTHLYNGFSAGFKFNWSEILFPGLRVKYVNDIDSF